MNIRERAKQLKTDVPAVYLALRDQETPLPAKLLAGLTVCYALSPIDLIPDFIPVLGYLDDVVILPALTALTIRCIPGEVWARSRARASEIWRDGRPKKWAFALPILALWALAIWLIVKAIRF